MRFWGKKNISSSPKVRIVASSYLDGQRKFHATICFINSFLCQTYQNFELFIVHDGPIPFGDNQYKQMLLNFIAQFENIKFFETEERLQKHGYPHRSKYALCDQEFDWVLFTNDDNYYAPVFLEALLSTADTPDIKLVYCDMIHSHTGWQVLDTKLGLCEIDIGAFMITKEVANKVPIPVMGDCFISDGIFISNILAKFPNCAKKSKHVFFVHN